MKIVVGCPIKDRAWALPEWFNSIWSQDVDLDVVCLYSDSEDNTLEVLNDNDVTILHDDFPGRSVEEINRHLWGNRERYVYMARLRNKLLDAVLEMDADVFVSLDSDILFPKNGLRHLLNTLETHPGAVSPAVNMLARGTAWNTMTWTDRWHPQTARRMPPVTQTDRVDVIMAAMVLDRSAMEAKWEVHAQGEDLGWCLNASTLGVDRWWVPEVRCTHLMQRY